MPFGATRLNTAVGSYPVLSRTATIEKNHKLILAMGAHDVANARTVLPKMQCWFYFLLALAAQGVRGAVTFNFARNKGSPLGDSMVGLRSISYRGGR